ncbi:MAG: ShlB/FhaC/HecB family hemolysin secretion/activation protein [Saprospiraceae bacterium]
MVFLTDSSHIQVYLDSILNDNFNSRYLGSKIDTFYCKDTCYAVIFNGQKIQHVDLEMGNDVKKVLTKLNISQKRFQDGVLDKEQRLEIFDKIGRYFGNIGYPYFMIKLDTVKIQSDTLLGKVHMEPDIRVKIDSITLVGNVKISKRFIQKYINISPNDWYNHSSIEDISARLQNLPYLTMEKPPAVWFRDNKASISLLLNKKPASRFDFLLGVIPQSNTNESKFVFTIDFFGELYNALNYGEYSFLQIRRFKPGQFDLALKSDIPFLGRLPFGSFLEFKIINAVTENFDVSLEVGGQMLMNKGNIVRILYNQFSSNLTDIDTTSLLATKRLPARLDLVQTSGGGQFIFRRLDYIYNPTKGFFFDVKAFIGQKSIKQNARILEIEGFENAYDTLKTNSLFSTMSLQGAYFVRLNSWSSLKFALSSQINYSDLQINLNEYYRIGGNKTLRGFDEQSIVTERYVYSTMEFHINFDKNSYLTLPFIDLGVAKVIDEAGITYTDQLLGIGLGINFGTKAGLFNVSFAAGTRKYLPIDFGKMKVHFGYTSLF